MNAEIKFHPRDVTMASHLRECSRDHIFWQMGVFDPHGMRIARFQSAVCADGADPNDLNLDEAARENAVYYPGNTVCIWLDTSLWMTEHLRDMPTPDGRSDI